MPHWRDYLNCHIWQCNTEGIILIATFDNATQRAESCHDANFVVTGIKGTEHAVISS